MKKFIKNTYIALTYLVVIAFITAGGILQIRISYFMILMWIFWSLFLSWVVTNFHGDQEKQLNQYITSCFFFLLSLSIFYISYQFDVSNVEYSDGSLKSYYLVNEPLLYYARYIGGGLLFINGFFNQSRF